MTRLLISVASAAEATLALQGGADIIDGKDAAAGPLAALATDTLRAIVAAVAGQRPVSATIGDWPAEPSLLLEQAERIAATGVDWVKIGFYPGGDWQACLRALSPLARRVPMIGLLFADRTPTPHKHVADFSEAGFSGVMLDTADKSGGGLRRHLDNTAIARFATEAAGHGLQCGLAGSLTVEDIATLAAIRPSVLGFRGAACRHGRRATGIDATRLAALREALDHALAATAG